MLKLIKKDRYIILFSIVVGLLVCFGSISLTASKYTNSMQKDLASRLIRFHCIANSDSKEDQELKLKVRDEILKVMKSKLENSNSIDETRKILLENKENVRQIAESVIEREGKSYSVEVKLENNVKFPVKKYGEIVLPAGEYEAFRVIIGKGEGKNWWCVMFPPLCFVDEATCTVDENTNQKIKKAVTPDEYRLITQHKDVNVKFKMLEI